VPNDQAPFFRSGPACERYEFYRNATGGRPLETRSEIERLWSRVSRFVDDDLPEGAMQHFAARYWEMELAEAFLARGLRLADKSDALGPDLHVLTPPCAVEAIVPGPGSGSDLVPSLLDGPGWVDHEKVILRLRAAIKEKHEKYLQYVLKEVLSPDEPFVVAINGCEVEMAMLEQTVPYIVSAVLPFGGLVLTFDIEKSDVVREGYDFRSEVRNAKGAPVSTTAFGDGSHTGISGVLYSWSNEANRPKFAGGGYLFVHNPTATNALPPGAFPFGREYFVTQKENGYSLRWCDHPPP